MDAGDTRKQAGRVAYGTVARLVGRTSGALVSLLALREATRYFGPDQWGPIAAAVAWFTIFSVLGGPGVATLAIREVARPTVDVRAAFGRAIGATLVVSGAGALLAAGIGVPVYWGRGGSLVLVLVLLPGIPLMALFNTSGAVLAGRGRSDVRAVLDLVSSLFLLAATLAVVDAHGHGSAYAAAYDVYLAAAAAGALGLAAHVLRPQLRGAFATLRPQLKASLPLGQFDIFAAAYARADSIMLFIIRGNQPVALYSVAFQVASFLFVLPSLLSNALLPDFMKAGAERRQYLARRGFDVMLSAALPLPVFGVVFARPLVVSIVGESFAGAGPLLAVLSGAVTIALLNGYLFQMAVFSGAEHGLWRAVGVVTVVNLGANGIAVSLWGATGAAWVMVLSEAVGLVAYWRIYRKSMPSPLGRRYPAAVVVAALGFAAAVCGLHAGLGLGSGQGLGTAPRALALLALYGVLLYGAATAARLLSHRRPAQPAAAETGEGAAGATLACPEVPDGR